MSDNIYGVRVRPLELAPGAPLDLQTKTYHGMVINEGSPQHLSIGRIQSWAPQMYSRDGTHIYELGFRNFGRPVDYVPGPGRNYSIVASKVEVWHHEFERVVGFQEEFVDLVAQRDPFTIEEALFHPSHAPGGSPELGLYRMWKYIGCWFTDKNPNAYEAEGDAKIITNATISFVSRIRTF